MIYLDRAATAPVRREVLEAMVPWWTKHFANPASQHEPGLAAAEGLAAARKQVADKLGARPMQVTFNSGGTEGANTAIKGIPWANPRGRHLVVGAVEHPAVLESARFMERNGYEVSYVRPDRDGRITTEALAEVLRDDTTLVSVQYANNEVGTIQPIRELAELTHEAGTLFHTDAVQAAGWLPLNVAELGVDALSIAGHKIGTPRGIGALWLRRGVAIEPLIHGGDQQPGRRSGTEDPAAAIGLATALRIANAEAAAHMQRVSQLRDRLIDGILSGIPGARLTGSVTERLPGHASFVFTETDGRSGESILIDLEQHGIVCSSGSACAAGHDEPSEVLLAMGLSREIAQTSVRMTFGTEITDDQVDQIIGATLKVFGRASK